MAAGRFVQLPHRALGLARLHPVLVGTDLAAVAGGIECLSRNEVHPRLGGQQLDSLRRTRAGGDSVLRRGIAVDSVPVLDDVIVGRLQRERSVLAHPVQPRVLRILRVGGRIITRGNRRRLRHTGVIDEIAAGRCTRRGPRRVLGSVVGAHVPMHPFVGRNRRGQTHREARARLLRRGQRRSPPGHHALAVTGVPCGPELHRHIISVGVRHLVRGDLSQSPHPGRVRRLLARPAVLHRQLRHLDLRRRLVVPNPQRRLVREALPRLGVRFAGSLETERHRRRLAARGLLNSGLDVELRVLGCAAGVSVGERLRCQMLDPETGGLLRIPGGGG